eukprot:1052927-Prymnesium_polylepis.1
MARACALILQVLGFGLARAPSRSSIFDPDKVLGEPEVFGSHPPPALELGALPRGPCSRCCA